MTLEELQALSDEQLNELAAIQVMGWEVVQRDGYKSFYNSDGTFIKDYAWNPAGDMNDAMELQNALGELHFIEYTVNLIEMTGHDGDINFGCVGDVLKLTPKQRTIAAIKAKLDDGIAAILAKESQ